MMSPATHTQLVAPLTTPQQFSRPLKFILEEHDRQQRFCEQLLDVVNGSRREALMALSEALTEYLTVDLPRHAEDEETDLWPLLERRSTPEDNFTNVLTQLELEHATERFLAHHIILDLKNIAKGNSLADWDRLFADVKNFAEGQLRHLAWENTVVMPLARARLVPDDLEAISRSMADRRGLALPG